MSRYQVFPNRGKMKVVYNSDGTVDLLATREIALGNPSEEDCEEVDPDYILDPNFPDTVPSQQAATPYEEFWNDPCWTEPAGILG